MPRSSAPDGLSYRQRLFVAYFLGKANGNATEAARLAGYAHPHVQGTRTLANVSVRVAIDARVAEAAMSADEVLARLSEHASGDIADHLKVNEHGDISLDFKSAKKADKLRLIKKIRPTRYGTAVEFYDSQAALDKLAKYHGLYSDDGTAATASESAELIREKMAQARAKRRPVAE